MASCCLKEGWNWNWRNVDDRRYSSSNGGHGVDLQRLPGGQIAGEPDESDRSESLAGWVFQSAVPNSVWDGEIMNTLPPSESISSVNGESELAVSV